MLSAYTRLKTKIIATDVEFKTGRIINGQTEFAKRISIGAVVNGKTQSFAKANGITTYKITSITGYIYSSSADAVWAMPNSEIETHISGKNIWVTNNCGSDITNGIVEISYTK